ncbi:hypothetical protein LJ737_19555 [Hymenobacter sp. 15J16-1T3B]|uniref:hypothetical protein n=1 Tax=Hymenobacter sp. 15J16-1T3B TaxID=2886941 RepID=UPI001D1288E4|nr:hypothetical protein [Hymenobacter sp. 15J16-1T3B]MCC3159447.1 hypothetical protein [Hymenobacter sp. 15J16-1T3B]
MRPFLPLLAAVTSALLTSCELCNDPMEPEPACATPATVRYPICNVANCPEHPILLVLNDGKELRPFGGEWDAFQATYPSALPEQVLISYKPEVTPAVHTWQNATLTCISTVAE